jgi:hypothetical protein
MKCGNYHLTRTVPLWLQVFPLSNAVSKLATRDNKGIAQNVPSRPGDIPKDKAAGAMFRVSFGRSYDSVAVLCCSATVQNSATTLRHTYTKLIP